MILNADVRDQQRLKNEEVDVLADGFQGTSPELSQASESSPPSPLAFLCPQTRVLRGAGALPPPPPQ